MYVDHLSLIFYLFVRPSKIWEICGDYSESDLQADLRRLGRLGSLTAFDNF